MRFSPAVVRILLLLPLLALACFCIFYLTHNHEFLARWYEALPGPFYKKTTWRTDFFTPQTKQQGNIFCWIALCGIGVLVWNCLRQPFPEKTKYFPENRLPRLLLPAIAAILGIWSATRLPPAVDEVFSAKYAAGGHPFRALSYYMLPNNHVLFNTLNAFISSESNALMTGRILSVLAYMLTGVLVYQWLREVISGKYAAFLIALLQLTIFPVWGFAGQARGYEIYLLAHWWCLLLTTRYFKTGDARTLFWFPVAATVGYSAVPSFLYFHLALLGWAIYQSLTEKKVHGTFWRTQLVAFTGAFLFYVPALCFSGVPALAGNKYVSGTGAVSWAALPPLGPYAAYLNGTGPGGKWMGLIVALLALSLLFSGKMRRWGVLFVALWLACDVVVLAMRKIPFHRNLIGQYSISFVLAGVAAVWIFRKFPAFIFRKRAAVAVPITAIVLGGALLFINNKQLSEKLYFYPVRETEEWVARAFFSKIPAGSRVAFSEETFLTEAFWKRQKGVVAFPENADFIVQFQAENRVGERDSLVAQSEDLQLYQRRP